MHMILWFASAIGQAVLISLSLRWLALGRRFLRGRAKSRGNAR